MKKIYLLLLIAIPLTIGFTSCKKEEQEPEKTLRVFVDAATSSGTIEGGTVKVYKHYDSYLTNQEPEAEQVISSNGIATFTNLPYGSYYFVFEGEGDCVRNNFNTGLGGHPDKTLISYKDDRDITLTALNSATLKINNLSNTFYSLYINDAAFSMTLRPNNSIPLFFHVSKDYNIKVTEYGNKSAIIKEVDVNSFCEVNTITLP